MVTKATFRNETMDVRIPFEITAESMKDENKTRDKIFGFIDVKKQTGNDRVNSPKKTVE